MERLTKFSMKNVSALFIMMFMLFGAGMYAANQLKMENMPDISFPVVVVTTQYTGGPQDVMEQVTEPLEDKLANMEELEAMSSTSSDNFSFIILEFKQGVDIDKKKQDVESLIQEVSLPASAERPRASTFGMSDQPIMYLVATATNGMSQTELDKTFEDVIEPALASVKDIDHLDVIGFRDTSLDFELDADALNAFRLTPSQVTSAIRAAVTKSPIGSVELNGNERNARVTGDIESLYELEQIEIPTAEHGIVRLSQVAEIQAISKSEFSARLGGNPSIAMILYKASGGNAVEFSDAVGKQLDNWKRTLPNIAFTVTYDSADEIRSSIHGLVREGLIGAVLCAAIILFFLRNVRMTLIVLVSIPLSILVTLLLMWQFGITLNTMSIGGIFIAIGRVVDDSIVVIENIYASLEKAQERNESVILLATKQVAMAITSSTLATAGVFAPIGLVSGIVGEFFRPFAITVVVALLSSLLVALTVIPMLSKLMVLRSKSKHGHSHDEAPQGKLTAAYESVLRWSLTHRYKTLLMAFVLFIGSIVGSMPFLSVSFLPSGKESQTMYFVMKLPYETTFETTDTKTKQLEKTLMETVDSEGNPVFNYVEALVGYDGDDEQQSPYTSRIYLEVNDRVDPAKVREQVRQYIESELPAGSEVQARSLGGGGGVSTIDFSYSLIGEDQTLLVHAAGMVKEKLERIPELSEIEDSLSDKKEEVVIHVDQRKARAYGLNAASVRDTALAWVHETSLGEDIKIDNITYSAKIYMKKADKNSLEKIGAIPLASSTGDIVHLNEVATISIVPAASSLTREDRQQLVEVTAKINSDNKSAVSAKIARELQQLELPDGVSRKVGGVSEDINESFSQLFLAMAVGVGMIYLIMVLAFGNAGAPFAILFSLPLAAIGGLLGLVITREALNVTSMIGFMMLIGIVVTNAIVLIDRAQQLREEGYAVRDALIEAGKVRLRPIIMTAAATIMALVPLAMGLHDSGGLVGKGLGIVVIGGLTTSTILTLVVVPIAYEMIESFKASVSRLFRKKSKATLEA